MTVSPRRTGKRVPSYVSQKLGTALAATADGASARRLPWHDTGRRSGLASGLCTFAARSWHSRAFRGGRTRSFPSLSRQLDIGTPLAEDPGPWLCDPSWRRSFFSLFLA